MKRSILSQFTVMFVAIMAGILLICVLFDNLFLGSYYMRSKEKVLLSVYNKIRIGADSGQLESDSFYEQLDKLLNSNNISVYSVNDKSKEVFVSKNGGRYLADRLSAKIFGFNNEPSIVLELTDEYAILRTLSQDVEYLEVFGRLDNGISFIISTPLASIKESANIANRFFAYVVIAAAVLGGIAMFFASKRITKPIQDITEISKKMVNLDFEARYTGKTNNELDVLGENINILSDSLERSVTELKTANNELKIDIEKREKIDEMRKEFLSNVSHELKTPLALIQGYAEGLKDGVTDDKESMDYYCDVISDEAAKMNTLVKKILTLNELEFGIEKINLERLNVTAIINNYLLSSSILAKQKNITVKFEENQPIFVFGDEFRIEEVLMNYFTNAINHCEGENVIDVKVLKLDKKVRISVFNTGKPIPEEAIDRVWEKFYKVDKARTREYGGAGVGLSIVKAIMDSFNEKCGVINYENGVAFWFELDSAEE